MASDNVRIALIGLTILERMGIREIAYHFPKVETKDFNHMAELQSSEGLADAFVVDSEAYLLNPTFFASFIMVRTASSISVSSLSK